MRQYLPSFAELIDALTIDQIKEVLSDQKEQATEDMLKISHDLELIIADKNIKLSARLIRIIIAIAQLNLHIWHNKEEMHLHPGQYEKLLILSHQLNGVRNQLKNILLSEISDESARKSNFNTDGLEGWNISI